MWHPNAERRIGVSRSPGWRGLAFALLFFIAGVQAAQARNWRIADFRSTIAIDEKGVTAVTEDITFVFSGSFQGVWRTIPINYPGPSGTNYRLFLKVTKVTDDQGAPLKYEITREGDYRKIKIWIPGAVDTTKRVEIGYLVSNAMRYFEDHDEFYWNVTGNDWPVPIDHASAFVSLPEKTAGGLRAQAFTGVYGSVQRDARAEVQGSSASFETTNPLSMRGGLTVDIYIPKGVLPEPGLLTRAMWFLRGNAVLFVPVWALAVMFTLWWYKGRDPDPGRSVAPMYEPPANITPAEAGTLLDDEINPRDITSTLIDLAVRGYLKIEQVEEPGFFWNSNDYVLHLLKDRNNWQGLAPFERVILENMFAGGQMTKLSSLRNHFYTAIPVIREDIFSSLKRKGMYWLDPQSAAGYSVLGVILSVGPPLALHFLGWISLFDSPLPVVVSAGLTIIVVWLFARQMTCKSSLGAKTYVSIVGFQEFMKRVDEDRLRRMPPDTFEKYLPYAMALGVEQQWAQAFAGIIKEPPKWYVAPDGGRMFNPVIFTNNVHSMANTAHQAFVAAPRASSSGSGWSSGGGFGGGGGFSGGGFGGGGGGAF